MTVPLFLSRRLRECARLCAASALLCLVLAPAFAQDPPDSGQPAAAVGADAPDPDDPRLKEPLPGLVTQEPYAHWTRHVGTIEQAIALVTARDAKGKTRETTGLVVRCDGFVLVPLWLNDALTKEKQAISVSVEEAENEALKGPFPVAGRAHFLTNSSTYTLLKVNNHHIPCLPLLDGKNVAVGDKVRVVHAEADGPGRCKAVSISARVVRQTEAELKGRRDRWVLRAEDGKAALTDETAPPGSVVVDEESGAAIGIVLEPTAPGQGPGEPVFSSFLYFYDVSADVGLMPDRAAIKERQGLPQWLSPGELEKLAIRRKSSGVVWVPGGAVQLDGDYAGQFRRAYGTAIACTPGFFISVNPVTNDDYRMWLAAMPPPRRVPRGWDQPDELANPRRNPAFPVLGVLPQDAQAYVAAHKQRLPTYVEWQRAAMSRNYAWAMDQWNVMRAAYDRVNSGLDAYLNFHNDREAYERESRKRNDLTLSTVGTAEYKRTIDYLMAVIRGLLSATGEGLPSQPCDVNLRKDDVSIFGVGNVLMNSPEMVLTSVSQPPILAPKFLPAPVDPYVSVIGDYEPPRSRRAGGSFRGSILRRDGSTTPAEGEWFIWQGRYDLQGTYFIDIALRKATDSNASAEFFLKFWSLAIHAGLTPGRGVWQGAGTGIADRDDSTGENQDVLAGISRSFWDSGTFVGFRGAR